MTLNAAPWDIQDHIKRSARQLGYLEAAAEHGDPAFLAIALADVARARTASGGAELKSAERNSRSASGAASSPVAPDPKPR